MSSESIDKKLLWCRHEQEFCHFAVHDEQCNFYKKGKGNPYQREMEACPLKAKTATTKKRQKHPTLF